MTASVVISGGVRTDCPKEILTVIHLLFVILWGRGGVLSKNNTLHFVKPHNKMLIIIK